MMPVGRGADQGRAQVFIETQAGVGSGFPAMTTQGRGDHRATRGSLRQRRHDRQGQGAAAAGDGRCCGRGQIVFTYFHFAADETLTAGRARQRASRPSPTRRSATRTGRLPLLTPMSEVAGRMSIQEGAKYLERPQRAAASCWAACRASRRPTSSILGGGVVGANAAKVAAGFGANVAHPRHQPGPPALPRRHHAAQRHDALFSDRHTIREQSERADLVIGAVLIPGAKAPRLVEREDLKLMKPGSVIIDVAIDQGGCVETSRPDDAQRADVHRRRRGPLLRDQHARRGRPHQHLSPCAT